MSKSQYGDKSEQDVESSSESDDKMDIENSSEPSNKMDVENSSDEASDVESDIATRTESDNKSVKSTTSHYTQNEVTNGWVQRSNSIRYDKAKDIPWPITLGDRQTVGIKPTNTEWADALKVAIFSREAAPKHFHKYQAKVQNTNDKDKITDYYSTVDGAGNKQTTDKAELEKFSSLLPFEKVENQEDVFKALFKNRTSPHVITVIEGTNDTLPEKDTINGDNYTLLKGAEGGSMQDAKLDVQKMHFYVRDDMQKAIQIKTPEIDVKAKGVSEKFKVGEIQFETNNEKYSLFTVHIPNKIAGLDTAKKFKEKDVQRSSEVTTAVEQALKGYAEKENRIMVGYLGDTNYKSPMQLNSLMSSAGVTTHGDTSVTSVTPVSSGAKKTSYFMQAVSSGKAAAPFNMLQGSSLNPIDLAGDKFKKERIDHPSFQTTILLDKRIENREKKDEKIETLDLHSAELDKILAEDVDYIQVMTNKVHVSEEQQLPRTNSLPVEKTNKVQRVSDKQQLLRTNSLPNRKELNSLHEDPNYGSVLSNEVFERQAQNLRRKFDCNEEKELKHKRPDKIEGNPLEQNLSLQKSRKIFYEMKKGLKNLKQETNNVSAEQGDESDYRNIKRTQPRGN